MVNRKLVRPNLAEIKEKLAPNRFPPMGGPAQAGASSHHHRRLFEIHRGRAGLAAQYLQYQVGGVEARLYSLHDAPSRGVQS